MPAAAGTKTMKAKLTVIPYKEMKPDIIKWVKSVPKLAKLYGKPITYEDKIDLNPKKWNEAALSKAMVTLVRAELQILATAASDGKKMADKAKSPKDENKVIAYMERAHKETVADIEKKCDEALEELESGKGEAKAGLAVGKKAMAKIDKLDVECVIQIPLQIGMITASRWYEPLEKGKEDKAKSELAIAQKQIDIAFDHLSETGKQAQAVAKYLIDTGKKLKNHENGQLANFGKAIMKDSVQPELAKMDAAIGKVEKALEPYAKALKAGGMDVATAKRYESQFKKMLPLQKLADKAVAEMKSLQGDFKKIEKDLK